MIAVFLPTRGLFAAPMVGRLFEELRGFEFLPFFSHDRKIPDSFNSVVLRALPHKWTHGLFIEEDVVVPNRMLERMLDLDADIAAIDYLLKSGTDALSHREAGGQILWVSLGCTLVRRRVFEITDPPWFAVDFQLVGIHDGSASNWRFRLEPRMSSYGDQDVYFCYRAREAGCSIGILPLTLCDHVGLKYETAFDSGPVEQVPQPAIPG